MNTPEIKQKQVSRKRMVPLRYVLMPFAIILIAVVILIFFAMLAPKPVKKPIISKPPLVEVQTISPQQVHFIIDSQGTVNPRTETVLISEVSGLVKNVSEKFVVGGFFKKGERILTIDDITYQVALLQAKSRLDSAQASLLEEQAKVEQAKHDWLLTGKPLAKAPILALRTPQLRRAEAALAAAQADVKEATVKLERTIITAPYDAMIKAKKVDIGQYVTMGTQLATTFAVDYAEVRLPIKQQDIAFLNLPSLTEKNALQSDVDLSMTTNGKTQHWHSYLARYEGEVDPNSRVHYVVTKVNDPYRLLDSTKTTDLRVGSFVQAKIAGKSIDNVLAIPRNAVHGANTINLLDANNELHIQNMAVLRSDHDYIYSQQTIPDGMRLIVTKLATPVEGMKLRVAGETENDIAIKQDKATDSAIKGE
jgi:RND family efflux transporter MFP subunit